MISQNNLSLQPNLSVQWHSYRFQIRKKLPVKIHSSLKHSVKYINLFRFIQCSFNEIYQRETFASFK